MAGLASYHNPETRGNPYCEGCGTKRWTILTNCADCEAELCSECGMEEGEDGWRSVEVWLCRACARRRTTDRVEESVALEAGQQDADQSALWEAARKDPLEVAEFPIAPQRAERMETNPRFDAEVA